MAQNENYSQVDLRVGTEEQFNAKVGTLPAGTLFGVTDSTVSKADLSTDLKNEINGKINKPANPTSDSAITINSSGTISTKPLASITGKTEVAVSSIQPVTGSSEVLWINPDGNSKYESLIDRKCTKSDVGLGSVINAGQDSTPTANSSNYVTSGGVKSYVDTATSILRAYPVGAIYISYNSTDPGDLFGGSWTQLENRFLLGAGTTYAARSMGGEATHKLTEGEMPEHSHSERIGWLDDQKTNNPLGANNYPLTVISSPNNARVDDPQAHAGLTGGSQAHNNMPPYLAVYMWRRVS